MSSLKMCKLMTVGSTLAMVLTLAFALRVTPAYAVHDDGIFQVDGDAFDNTCGTSFPGGIGCTGDDWNDLYTCSGTYGQCTKNTAGVGNSASVIADFVFDPAPLSTFIGGGSKDEENLNQWAWTNGSVPDKDDLIEAFAARYEPTSGPRAGHSIIYFGANRLAVNGDAQIGIWFFQRPVVLGGSGVHASPFLDDITGGPAFHLVGDVLVLSNFVQGGGMANVQVYKVTAVNTGNGKIKCPTGSIETSAPAGGICTQQLVSGTAGTNGVCNQAVGSFPADSACAATNGDIVASLDPAFTAKSGANTGQYPVVGFFEGGVDLTNLQLSGECFSTFLMESRSSQSITAVLKDFALGGFQRCFAEIETHIFRNDTSEEVTCGVAADCTVRPGTVIHDEADVASAVTGVKNDPGFGSTTGSCATLGQPLDCTVTFKLFAATLNGSGDLVCPASNATPITTERKLCNSDGVGSGSCTAISSNFTTATPPGYAYSATYNGDSNNPSATLAVCELVGVGKLQSFISTDIFKSSSSSTCTPTGNAITDDFIDLNGAATQPVCDQATVTGGAGNPTPTGTVTFTQFSNGNCGGTGTSLGSFPLDASGVALSSVFSLGANGLSYKASYSGDSLYLPSDVSRCEPVCAIDTSK